MLKELGVTVESSVVPGALLVDPEKGFDFSALPDKPWWFFEQTPSQPAPAGEFLEVAVTPYTVSRLFYWGRLFDRLSGGQQSQKFGDGVSKAIGRKEILRRLAGGSRTSELSIDDAKAGYLSETPVACRQRDLWHLMGHPKLLSERSLQSLEHFMAAAGIRRSISLKEVAGEIRAEHLK